MTAAPYQAQPLPGGVYVPLITPFRHDQELDVDALKLHVTRLAKAGVGLVLLGTNGEASHLSDSERFTVIQTARNTVAQQSATANTPIIAGTGAGSTHHTIALCKEAARAGADAVIVVAPGYFASVGGIAKDRTALKQFFTDIADASPIPVMVYNFPACAGGIDLDSDLLEEIAQHKNIVGAKLTCAMVGKGLRLADSPAAAAHVAAGRPFHVFPGFADMLLPSLLSGMTGVIAGTGNIFPLLLRQLYELGTQALDPATPAPAAQKALADAQRLQQLVARADWAVCKAGIKGTKWALSKWYYDVGLPRRPLQPADDATQQLVESTFAEALEAERKLERLHIAASK